MSSESLYPVSSAKSIIFTDVTTQNLEQLHSQILDVIRSASFCSVDLEFSGLPPNMFAHNIEERYRAMSKLATNYALLSMGVSVFTMSGENAWVVNNFNFLLCNENEYLVSPKSIRFLVNNGFDTNRQIQDGILYTPGTLTKLKKEPAPLNYILRQVFEAIVKVPLVLHNGFADVVSLYYAFYGDLPPTLESFVADLSDLTNLVFDTKYIAEYVQREKTTFLEWLFRKIEREHHDRTQRNESLFSLSFADALSWPRNTASSLPSLIPVKRKWSSSNDFPYCLDFASFGYCKMERRCGKSHDVDFIMDYQKGKSTKQVSINVKECPDIDPALSDIVSKVSGAHNSVVDAFMTGYIFQFQLASIPILLSKAEGIGEHANKLYLSKKDFPLRIIKSEFAGYSQTHLSKRNYNSSINI